MGVKGSWQRPGEGYGDGWEAIFEKKPKEQPEPAPADNDKNDQEEQQE
jgi:hypothetical protein